MAAEVGPGGLLRFAGSGQPVHTLSPEDSAQLAADPAGWRAAEQAAAAMARGGGDGATEVPVFARLLHWLDCHDSRAFFRPCLCPLQIYLYFWLSLLADAIPTSAS